MHEPWRTLGKDHMLPPSWGGGPVNNSTLLAAGWALHQDCSGAGFPLAFALHLGIKGRSSFWNRKTSSKTWASRTKVRSEGEKEGPHLPMFTQTTLPFEVLRPAVCSRVPPSSHHAAPLSLPGSCKVLVSAASVGGGGHILVRRDLFGRQKGQADVVSRGELKLHLFCS